MFITHATLSPCRDFAQKLASALAHNPNSGLHMINLAGNPLEDRGTYYHRCQRCRTLASCFTGLGSSTNFRLVTWSPCHTKSRPHKPGGLSTLALTHTLRVSLACTWNTPHSTRVLPTPTRNSPHTQVESRPCSSWVLLINGQQQSNFPWGCRAQGPCALAQSQWRPLQDLIGCLFVSSLPQGSLWC